MIYKKHKTYVATSQLKQLLDSRRMSIRELSRRTNHSFETIRLLYHDRMVNYPRGLIGKICTELDVPISRLITLEEAKSNAENET